MHHRRPPLQLVVSGVLAADTLCAVTTPAEARFWWVSRIPTELRWRSPGYAVTLQDCLMLCNDRFIIAGP